VFFNSSKPASSDIPSFVADGESIEITVTFDGAGSKFVKTLGLTGDKLTLTKKFPIDRKGPAAKLGSAVEILNDKPLKDYKGPFSGIAARREFVKKHLPSYYYVPALRNLADEGKFKRGSLIQDLLLPLLDDSAVADDCSITDHLSAIESILRDRSRAIEDDISAILRDRVDDFGRLAFDFSTTDLKKALSPGVLVNPASSDDAYSAIHQGAGTQNFIILALAQHLARGISPVDLIIAFEEPEISLHSAAQRNMLDMIYRILENERQQIFLTTHSTIFIDSAADNVCLVKKTNGRTSLTVPRNTKEILSQLGIRGSDYFTSDALIFVEGTTDYEVFRIWAENCAPDCWRKFLFTFVPLGGLFSIQHFKTEDYSHLSSRIYAIIDRDIPSTSNSFKSITRGIVSKITKDLGGMIKILQRKELENYFTFNAVKQVFPDAGDAIDTTILGNPDADVKAHLTEVIRKQHYQRYHTMADYDEKITAKQQYNTYHAKEIAKAMVELNEVPTEFVEMLKAFADDLAGKLPRY